MFCHTDTVERGRSVPAIVVRGTDISVIEDSVEGMPLEAARLTGSGGKVTVAGLRLGALSVSVGAFDFPVATFGEAIPGTEVIAVPLSEAQGSWNGVELGPRSLWRYPPGSEHGGAARRPPNFAAVTIPHERMGVEPADGVTVREGDDVARLGLLLRMVSERLLGGGLTSELLPAMEADLRATLDDALSAPAAGEPRMTASAQIVRSCLDAADQIGPSPRVYALAASVDVTERWIRAAFGREFGVSPSVFFRARNLHRARRDLRLAHPADTTVTEVALRRGFWHLGRFAGLYRRVFGEPPNETLQRAY